MLQNGAIQLAAPTALQGATQYIIQNWLGFLGSVSPNIVDTSVTGNLRLRITLTNPQVNVVGVGGNSTGFQLSQIYFTCDTCAINDGIYSQLQAQYLNQGGVFEMPYRNYFSFSSSVSSMSQTTKWSLASSCLNRVWGCFVNQTTFPISAVGTVSSPSPGSSLDPVTGNCAYFSRLGNTQITYGSGANTTTQTNPLFNHQFQISSVYYPAYQVDPGFAYGNMLCSYGLAQDTLGGGHPNLKSLGAWNSSFWVAEQRFNFGDQDGTSLLSGQDQKGTTAQAAFITNGGAITSTTTGTGAAAAPGANLTVLVFAEVTSVLRVAAGRQIEIVL